MLSWLVRLILLFSGMIAGWIIARDAPNFGVVQAMTALLLIALSAFVLAIWPARWTHIINRAGGRPNEFAGD